MKRNFLMIAAIGAFSTFSYATWAWIPVEILVQDSDLIIVGTLSGVSEHTQNGIDYAEGSIRIDEVMWGPAKAGDSLTLKWQNHSAIICPRVEHRHSQGTRGIWLLTVEADRTVRADYPGRFVALGERTKVEQTLLKNKVCLRTAKYGFDPNEPADISLIFRNPTQTPMAFPGLEYKDGRLIMDPDIMLSLYSWEDQDRIRTTPRPNRIVSARGLSPIIVAPQQEFRFTFDLRDLFDVLPERNYSVRVGVKGHGRANDVGVYSRTAANPADDNAVQERATVKHTAPGSRFELMLSSILVFAGTCFLAYRHRKRR